MYKLHFSAKGTAAPSPGPIPSFKGIPSLHISPYVPVDGTSFHTFGTQHGHPQTGARGQLPSHGNAEMRFVSGSATGYC